MTVAATRIPGAVTAGFVPVDRNRRPAGPGWLAGAAAIAADLVALVGIVLCVPLVILAIGTPLALAVRLLLRVTGLL